jgi:predicted phage terminase large subunit-like protein
LNATCNNSRSPAKTLLSEFHRTVTDNPFIGGIGIVPTQRQAAFLTYPAKEILYGGAAGGGKSAALLMAALQYVIEPGYDALLLRRTFADLSKPRALIPLSMEWLSGTPAKWDSQQHQWRFPSGASLSFGYLETEKHKYQYQSAAYQFVGFDELTQFSESQYRYLFSRCRRLFGSSVPSRVRAASNPGGEGHEWVKSRLIDGQRPGRRFVKALKEENPYLDQEDYDIQLAELDLVTREQLQHGDWDIRPEGNLFKREWFTDAYVDQPPPVTRWVRFWDLAATKQQDNNDPDYAAGVRMGQCEDGQFVIDDVRHLRDRPQAVERSVSATARMDGTDTEVRIEQEPGASAKLYIDSFARRILPDFDVRGVRAMADKVTRAKPFSAACERGDVLIVRGAWVAGFLDELCAFPLVAHDDRVDAATGAYAVLSNRINSFGAAEWANVFGKAKRTEPATR